MEAKTKETNEFKILQEKEDRLNEAIQMYNEGLPSPRALSERVRELEALNKELVSLVERFHNNYEEDDQYPSRQESESVLSKARKEQP